MSNSDEDQLNARERFALLEDFHRMLDEGASLEDPPCTCDGGVVGLHQLPSWDPRYARFRAFWDKVAFDPRTRCDWDSSALRINGEAFDITVPCPDCTPGYTVAVIRGMRDLEKRIQQVWEKAGGA